MPTQDASLQYLLQESSESGFHDAVTLYQGPDRATVLSGRGDGLRYYRVRAIKGDQPLSQWSETLSVETRHHPLLRALIFFAIGAIVFVLTAAVILRGSREHRQAGRPVASQHDG